MSRISQALAEQIAVKLTAKKQALIDPLLLEFRTYLTQVYENRVPKSVMELFKSHSEYLKTVKTLYLDEKGFNRESVSMVKALPAIDSYSHHLKMTEPEAAKAKKLYNAWQKAKEDYKALFEETENALLNLRSFSNIEKQLPEAIPFIPQRGLTVIVNTDQLRKKLKSA